MLTNILVVIIILVAALTIFMFCRKVKPSILNILSALDQDTWSSTNDTIRSVEKNQHIRKESLLWYHGMLSGLETRGYLASRMVNPPAAERSAARGGTRKQWRLTEAGVTERDKLKEAMYY